MKTWHLATAVLRWLDNGCDQSGIFELHDGQAGGYGWRDVTNIVTRISGRRVMHISVSESALRWMAELNLAIASLRRSAPMLTPGKVRELRHRDWVCDNMALNRAIGWSPLLPFEQGLRRTFEQERIVGSWRKAVP